MGWMKKVALFFSLAFIGFGGIYLFTIQIAMQTELDLHVYPSLTIIVHNAPAEPYYLDLLIDEKSERHQAHHINDAIHVLYAAMVLVYMPCNW